MRRRAFLRWSMLGATLPLLPDTIQQPFMYARGDYLYFMGEKTTEVWYLPEMTRQRVMNRGLIESLEEHV